MTLAGLLAAVAGCQPESGALDLDPLDRTSSALEGGSIDAEFPGVCGIKVVPPPDPDEPIIDPNPEPVYCSCSLVADRIVLTAAHCVEPNMTADKCHDPDNEPPCDEDIDLRFGTSFDSATSVALGEIRVHRYYDPDTAPGVNDIAMIRLAEDPTGSPAPAVVTLNEQPLDASLQGETITFVGYGLTDATADDFGTRRSVDVAVSGVNDASLSAGTADTTPCRGDDGGPAFYDFGAGPVQISLNGDISKCNPNSRRTRVDVFVDDFIYPFIDGYVGACTIDDNCVDTGCRTPDPDCDTSGCSLDGTCVEDCPTRDFDCPLGVFPRGVCTSDGECELGGRCIAAADDPEFTYCTQPCTDDADCPADGGDMVCNSDGECEFTVPSPGSQGRPCGESSDCRSGICEEDICVIECTADTDCPAAPEGAEPYRCLPSNVKDGASVCIGTIVTGGGGFCDPNSVSGRGDDGVPGGALVVMLAGLGLVIRSRRRR